MSAIPPMTTATNTGAITSLGVGSGLDLSGLLDQLQAGENQKLTPITNRQQSYQAKISAFGLLNSALSTFQDAAHALTDSATFQPVHSNVTGDAVTATTTSATPPGDYAISVTQRAQASSVATVGVADDEANLGAGNITFTLADGTSVSVDIAAADSNVQNIRDAINAKSGGVTASLINDGSGTPYRLVLRASETGSQAAVSNVQISGDLGTALQLDNSTQQAGQDAQLSVNGIAIQSATNTVEDAIQGVTLNLGEAGDATLQVTRDDGAITQSVQNFVDSYNKLVGSVGQLTSYDADTQTAGILLGNSTARSVRSQLSRVLGGTVDTGGTFAVLSDVGITLQLDGTLKLDGSKFGKAESTNLDALQQFFAGNASNPGMAAKVDDAITKMTGTGGLIPTATDGFKASISDLQQQYTTMQARIATTMSTYRTQFTQLDTMIAQMNSTSSYLTQQFDALSKITSGSK